MNRERRLLAATAALAVGVPFGAAAWVAHRTAALADHLGAAAGVAARIGNVDADLTGTIRLTDVGLGELFAADAIEGSVALDSLLAGKLGADEIRVAGPRVTIAIDPSGDSDLARLIRRFAGAPASSHDDAPPRVRRIVVDSGSLVARIAGVGELAADDVELIPDAGGVRVVTGAVRLRGGVGRLTGEVELARSAAELALPHVKFGRVLAVAGSGALEVDGRKIALRDVAIGRLVPGGPLEASATLEDGRVISAELAPLRDRDLSITVRGDR